MPRPFAGLAVALLLSGPVAAQDVPQRILAVFAHPDDELVVAPALAALARQGHVVTMVHATPGDAGPGVSGFAPGPELAEARRGEAQCAASALGVGLDDNLGFGDGRLSDQARLTPAQPGSLAAELATKVALADLILTWGPDGGYGHADHRMVGAIVTQLVQAMPATGRPALLYPGIRAGTLPPMPEMQGWAVTDPALLTERIAYTPADIEAAKEAAQCHVTQFDAATRAGMMPLFDATIWQGAVHFRPALQP